MITAPPPRASPSGSGRLSMIIPRYYGLTTIATSINRTVKITRKWFPLQGELAPIKNMWYFRIYNKPTDSFHASYWHSP